MSEKSFVCICCPLGCTLKTTADGDKITVTGNTCKRGEKYAITELTAPVRTVTSSIKLVGGDIARLPVKTEQPIPKDKIFAALYEIKSCVARSPIKIGAVIIENVAGTGVKVIATRSV